MQKLRSLIWLKIPLLSTLLMKCVSELYIRYMQHEMCLRHVKLVIYMKRVDKQLIMNWKHSQVYPPKTRMKNIEMWGASVICHGSIREGVISQKYEIKITRKWFHILCIFKRPKKIQQLLWLVTVMRLIYWLTYDHHFILSQHAQLRRNHWEMEWCPERPLVVRIRQE